MSSRKKTARTKSPIEEEEVEEEDLEEEEEEDEDLEEEEDVEEEIIEEEEQEQAEKQAKQSTTTPKSELTPTSKKKKVETIPMKTMTSETPKEAITPIAKKSSPVPMTNAPPAYDETVKVNKTKKVKGSGSSTNLTETTTVTKSRKAKKGPTTLPEDTKSVIVEEGPKTTYVVPGPLGAPSVIQTGVVVKRVWSYRWMRYIAEFIGTFMICFVVTMTNAQLGTFHGDVFVPSIGGYMFFVEAILAQVFIYAIMYAIFKPVSGGHFNPAVTFGYMCLFEMGWIVGIMYILFQLAGAICAGLLAWAVYDGSLYGAPILDPYRICNIHPDDLNAPGNLPDCTFYPGGGRGFLIELIGTTCVVFTFFMADLSLFVGSFSWLVIGFAYGAFFFALKVFTNAFFNPAVAIGSAIGSIYYNWASNYWLFIIAPAVASIVAAVLYGLLFQIEGHGTGPHLKFWSSLNKRPNVIDPSDTTY